MVFQNQKKLVPGVRGFIRPPAVDEDGPLARCGNFELAYETLPLHVMWRALVIVIEADLAAGDHFRLSKKRGQFGESLLVGFGGVVRVNARARIKAWQLRPLLSSPVELAAKIERLMHFCWTLADADREHRAHTGLPCAVEHGFAIVRIPGTIQMSMGIDQQINLGCCAAGNQKLK